MKKWQAYGVISGTKYLGEVEAETEEEAKEKAFALDAAWVSLCYQCSSQCSDPEIQDIELEEVEE